MSLQAPDHAMQGLVSLLATIDFHDGQTLWRTGVLLIKSFPRLAILVVDIDVKWFECGQSLDSWGGRDCRR